MSKPTQGESNFKLEISHAAYNEAYARVIAYPGLPPAENPPDPEKAPHHL